MRYKLKVGKFLLIFALHFSSLSCNFIQAMGLCDFKEMAALRRNTFSKDGDISTQPEENREHIPTTDSYATNGADPTWFMTDPATTALYSESTSAPWNIEVTTEHIPATESYATNGVDTTWSMTDPATTALYSESTSAPWNIKVTTAIPSSTEKSCPKNMVFMTCTCQATCQDPSGLTGCHNNCTKEKTCICPEGFYLDGDDCVPPEQCGCFYPHWGFIQEGAMELVINCTKQCSCSNDEIFCIDYECSVNAACEDRKDSFQCYCNEGYHGNGAECTRLYDCKDIYDARLREEGVYRIYPSNWSGSPFKVYCKNGWTVFQRRTDGSTNFFRSWIDYKEGFGGLKNEMWLGNEKLHYLTNQRANQLKITLDIDEIDHWLLYDHFKIGNESANYVLNGLGNYNGSIDFDYMFFHKNQMFTTMDRDNDIHAVNNCAVRHIGAWWYKNCYRMSLNGAYGGTWDFGICLWNKDTGAKDCNVSFTEMSIKPI